MWLLKVKFEAKVLKSEFKRNTGSRSFERFHIWFAKLS